LLPDQAKKCVNPALKAHQQPKRSKRAPKQLNQLRRVSKMPADKYGKSLYKAGTVKAEKAAIANRDPARKAAAEKILAREGSTNPSGGRSAAKMMAPKAAPKPKPIPKVKAPQVIRTTTMMKPTPMGKKR
jgi:hypothetical protein